ncbi:MAG: phenylalanine--tRNA ligase subunit alpha [Candidatus Nanoarchaeia archaeon]|nr:phenylalanine--tRNA ligase subunit alpha [Candidatus Nanoarchaeia archaeon]
MAYKKQVEIKGQKYWYLFHTVRHGDKYLKKSKYIGKELPENIDEIEKEFLKEVKMEKQEISKEIKELAESMHPYERKVLPFLKENKSLREIVKASKMKEIEVMRALQWLENKNVISIKKELKEITSLGKNGKIYLEKDMPEKRFLKAIDGTTPVAEIKEKAGLEKDEINICLGLLRRKAAIEIQEGMNIKITEQGKKLLQKPSFEELFMKQLPLESKNLTQEQKYAFNELKNRKDIIKTDIVTERNVELKEVYNDLIKAKVSFKNIIDELSPEIIKNNSWKNKSFRRYDIKINVPSISGGRRHFVNEAVQYIKKVWLEMGFKEMKGPLLQTSFWNFDALFTAQDHPAREMQDTFFIKNPDKGKLPDKKIVEGVKNAHENGFNTGSLGWRYKWSPEIAMKNVLRTHTTVLSARTIAALKKEDLPAKFFTVGKCFRNETVDWCHLFELCQVEGIVVDPDVNFKNLVGYLTEFYKKLGYPKVRIRPAYFPYTEMSAEVDVFHPVRKEWVELGGSGIFRPEVVKPLLGIEVPVLAWGLGMERAISMYYEINDIRDLYRNDLKQSREIKAWLK